MSEIVRLVLSYIRCSPERTVVSGTDCVSPTFRLELGCIYVAMVLFSNRPGICPTLSFYSCRCQNHQQKWILARILQLLQGPRCHNIIITTAGRTKISITHRECRAKASDVLGFDYIRSIYCQRQRTTVPIPTPTHSNLQFWYSV